jgi:hypothetical protein
MTVVHFARIDSDHVAGTGLDRATAAGGFLGATDDHADAELVMRMAAEAVRRVGLHGLTPSIAHCRIRNWPVFIR